MGTVMERKEVSLRTVDDIMFKRIGVELPVRSEGDSFSSDQIPARALAVSNNFGFTLFIHVQGFSLARTAVLLGMAEKLEREPNEMKFALDASIINVLVPDIRMLALSSDELTVGVCAGRSVMFHKLENLVYKSDPEPFEVQNVDPEDGVYCRDFSWCPSRSESYLVLTSGGKLLSGRLGSTLACKVEKGVVSASWNTDGQQIAYVTSDDQLNIVTTNFIHVFQVDLPVQLDVEDNGSKLHVDSIRWVRPDSIVIGYVGVNEDGEEDECPLFVLNSSNGIIGQEGSELRGLQFYQLFPSIDSFVIPAGSGPYMLIDYVKPWELVVAASRRSIDDHILLAGWLPEDGKEVVYSLEMGNDAWIPRIELQESGDDNAVLGLAVDYTTTQIQWPDPRDESGDTMLPACPVLISLTLEGKLSFYSFARLDDKSLGTSDFIKRISSVPNVQQPVLESAPSSSRKEENKAVIPIRPSDHVKSEPNKDVGLSFKPEPAKEVGLASKAEPTKNISFSYKAEPNKDVSLPFKSEPAKNVNLPFKTEPAKNVNLPFKTEPAKDVGVPVVVPAALGGSSDRPSRTSLPSRDATKSEIATDAHKANFRAPDEMSSGHGRTTLSQSPWGLQPSAANSSPATLAPHKTGSVETGLRPSPFSKAGGNFAQTVPSAFKGELGANHIGKVPSGQQGFGRFTANTRSREMQDQHLSRRATGVIDMEATFIAEMEEIKKMCEETEDLISSIEGSRNKNEDPSSSLFTRLTLEKLENDIRVVRDSCKEYREEILKQRRDIEDLCDEEMRVDAWRIYARNLMNQKKDTRRQELWARQKLHPELAMRRKHVLKADQDLKLQIADLEGHLHNLELKHRHQNSTRRRPNRRLQNPNASDGIDALETTVHSPAYPKQSMDNWNRQFLTAQNIYNTVNTQMAIAEELSHSLAQQMEALDINLSSPAKEPKSAASSILGSIGINTDDSRKVRSPGVRNQWSDSPPPKGTPIDMPLTPAHFERSVQESTRRRRDSMDAAWVKREAPTTTIRRATRSRPDRSRSAIESDTQTPAHELTSSFKGHTKENRTFSHLRPSMDQKAGQQPSATPRFSTRTSGGLVPPPVQSTMSSAVQWPLSGATSKKTESALTSNQPPREVPAGLTKLTSSVGTSAKQVSSRHSEPSAVSYSSGGISDLAGGFLMGTSSGFPLARASSAQGPRFSAPTTESQVEKNKLGNPEGNERLHVMSSAKLFNNGLRTGTASTSHTAPSSGPMPLRAHTSPAVGSNPGIPQTKSSTVLQDGGFPAASILRSSTMPQNSPRINIAESVTGATKPPISSASSSVELSQSGRQEQEPGDSQDNLGQTASKDPSPGLIFPTFSDSSSALALPRIEKGSSTKLSGPSTANKEKARKPEHDQVGPAKSISPKFEPWAIDLNSPSSTVLTSSAPSLSTLDSRSRSLENLALKPGTFLAQGAPHISGPSTVQAGNRPEIVQRERDASTERQTEAPARALALARAQAAPPASTAAPAPAPTSTPAPAPAPAPSPTPASTPAPAPTPFLTSASAPDSVQSPGPTPAPASAPNPAPTLSLTSTSTAPSVTHFDVGSPVAKDKLTPLNMGSFSMSDSGNPSSSSPSSSIFSSPAATLKSFGDVASGSPPTSAPGQSSGSLFASTSMSGVGTSSLSGSPSAFGQMGLWQSPPQQQPFAFPGSSSSSMISSAIASQPSAESNEEDMEEEATTGIGTFAGFGGLGLGNSATPDQTQKKNPFGGSTFVGSPGFQSQTAAGGQLFRPAAFSLPVAQSPPAQSPPQQQFQGSAFGSGFGSSGFSQGSPFSETGKSFGSPQSMQGGFGQPAQVGAGQQALGNALGTFGQTRQVGFGANSFGGSAMGGSTATGFPTTSPGGGFAGAGSGGGFAGAGMGGRFPSGASGGGFANLASGGGGFAGAASGTGGFAGAASGSGGFAGAGSGGGFGSVGGGGFQAFGVSQGASPGFGSGVPPAQSSLFTQMRR